MHRNDRAALLGALAIVLYLGTIAALLLLAGCGRLSLLPRRPALVGDTSIAPVITPACVALNRSVIAATASSIALGILSGGGGVASLFTASTPRYVTGGISIGLTASAGVAAYLSTAYAASFTQQCTVGAP